MRTRKSADERRAEIVETTLRLADTTGPDRLSTEAIASAVGLTQAAVFRHFPRKRDIWEAVARRIGETFEEGWRKAECRGGSGKERLCRLVGGQLRVIRAVPAIPAILFSRELHVENDRLRAVFLGLMQRFHRLAVRFFEEGQRVGEFRSDLDPRDHAFLVIGLAQALVLRWSLAGRAFDLAAEGERLLRIHLDCLAPRTGGGEPPS